jgi:hypothetical protein
MVSEIARIRETIAASYMAAQWGLSGLAYGTSQHSFITARMEQMEEGYKALEAIVGDQAIAIIAETITNLPEKPTRHHIEGVLQHELGNTEETAHLFDHLKDAWETLDLLIMRFGMEGAQKLINASSSFIPEKEREAYE